MQQVTVLIIDDNDKAVDKYRQAIERLNKDSGKVFSYIAASNEADALRAVAQGGYYFVALSSCVDDDGMFVDVNTRVLPALVEAVNRFPIMVIRVPQWATVSFGYNLHLTTKVHRYSEDACDIVALVIFRWAQNTR